MGVGGDEEKDRSRARRVAEGDDDDDSGGGDEEKTGASIGSRNTNNVTATGHQQPCSRAPGYASGHTTTTRNNDAMGRVRASGGQQRPVRLVSVGSDLGRVGVSTAATAAAAAAVDRSSLNVASLNGTGGTDAADNNDDDNDDVGASPPPPSRPTMTKKKSSPPPLKRQPGVSSTESTVTTPATSGAAFSTMAAT